MSEITGTEKYKYKATLIPINQEPYECQAPINYNHVGITSMKEYQEISYEELRYDDYMNKKRFSREIFEKGLFQFSSGFGTKKVDTESTSTKNKSLDKSICPICMETLCEVCIFRFNIRFNFKKLAFFILY